MRPMHVLIVTGEIHFNIISMFYYYYCSCIFLQVGPWQSSQLSWTSEWRCRLGVLWLSWMGLVVLQGEHGFGLNSPVTVWWLMILSLVMLLGWSMSTINPVRFCSSSNDGVRLPCPSYENAHNNKFACVGQFPMCFKFNIGTSTFYFIKIWTLRKYICLALIGWGKIHVHACCYT